LLIINALPDHGATMTAYDPVALAEARQKLRGRMGVLYADGSVQALHGADALIIATEWKFLQSGLWRAEAQAQGTGHF
jgi:UDPglucose 6-dehydrogenase